MRKKLLFLNLILFVGTDAFSQLIRTPVSASFLRLNTYSSLHGSAFSFTGNQGALASVKNMAAAVYSERRFLLEEASVYAAAIVLPSSSGNFGFKADYSGDLSYNETGLGLAYGRKLGNKIDIGAQFNYYSFKAAGYGTAAAITAEAGIVVHLTEALQAGFHLYNPTGMEIGKTGEEKLPAIYAAGFGWEVSDKFFMGAEAQKIEGQPASLSAGLHYYFDGKLSASAGINSGVSAYYFGFGVLMKNMALHAVASIHPQLGLTPGLLLVFNPVKKGA